MKKWQITRNLINGEWRYAAFKRLREGEPDHSGNRVISEKGYMPTLDEALKECNRLNAAEG